MILKSISKKKFCTLIIILAFLIAISQIISSRFLIIILVLSFFYWSPKVLINSIIFQCWDIILFIFILALGLFYSERFKIGLSLLETSFSLVAIPMIAVKIGNFSKLKIYNIFYGFSFGLVLTSMVFLFNNLLKQISFFNINTFFPDKFTGIINSDPTYFSYYLIFAITFCLYLLYFNEVTKRRGYVVGLVIFFFIMLTLTAGTSSYISILLVLAFFILKFLTEPKRDDYKLVAFGLSLLFLFSLFLISYFKIAPIEGKDYWERFVLWEAAIKATPNLLIGVGTGDYNVVLNEYYRTHNLSQFSLSNYNAHNQFIQTLLSNGIIGLIALLIMMIRPLYLSLKYQNPLGILVFFSFFVYGLTEVFLGRYQGVVFFALMHQSFIAYYHSQSKLVAVKE